MCTIPKLSTAVQKQMVRQARHRGFDGAAMLRLLAVLAVASGSSRRKVASVFHCAASTVVRSVQRFTHGSFEALGDQRCHNGRHKLSLDYLERLYAVVQLRADEFGWQRPTWTRESLALTLAEQDFALVAPCTVGRALRQIGARRGRPKPTVHCPWPKRLRNKVLGSLRQLEQSASDEQPVVFADEVDLHLNPKVGLDWMNPRTRSTIWRGLWTAAPGGSLLSTGRTKIAACSAVCSSSWCRSIPTPAKTIHVILDNYGIHKSRQVHNKLTALGGRIQLHFLPPYCPDSNRIEREWQELHANVTRNHRCKYLLTLLAYVLAYLDQRNSGSDLKPSLRKHNAAAA